MRNPNNPQSLARLEPTPILEKTKRALICISTVAGAYFLLSSVEVLPEIAANTSQSAISVLLARCIECLQFIAGSGAENGVS